MLFKNELDFVGLSTEEKPLNDYIKNGSTYYTVDTQELYVYYEGVWYNQTNPENNTEPTQNTQRTIEQIEVPEVEKKDVPEATNNDEMR